MDIFESGLPNIRIRNIGTKRKPLEVVEARIVLEAWDGYLYKHRENGKEITDGMVALDFGGYNGDKSLDWQPQINAYHDLLKNQYEIRDSIVRTLREKFDWLKKTYDWDQDDDITTETKADFDFKPFIGPTSVNFDEEESKDGIAYLQWHFDCAWDPEHGFAVTTHGVRVIDIDQDTDPFKIYEDNGTLEKQQKEYEEWKKNYKPPKPQKPWWQFW